MDSAETTMAMKMAATEEIVMETIMAVVAATEGIATETIMAAVVAEVDAEAVVVVVAEGSTEMITMRRETSTTTEKRVEERTAKSQEKKLSFTFLQSQLTTKKKCLDPGLAVVSISRNTKRSLFKLQGKIFQKLSQISKLLV